MTDEANSEVKGEMTNEVAGKPAAEPVPAYEDGLLDVGDGHAVYWRAQGPKDAPVMLIVHGGPGGAMNLKWADVLDASKWRMFSSINAAAANPRRSASWSTTARMILSAIWRSCGSPSASRSGRCSAARGAQLSRSATA